MASFQELTSRALKHSINPALILRMVRKRCKELPPHDAIASASVLVPGSGNPNPQDHPFLSQLLLRRHPAMRASSLLGRRDKRSPPFKPEALLQPTQTSQWCYHKAPTPSPKRLLGAGFLTVQDFFEHDPLCKGRGPAMRKPSVQQIGL